MVNSLRRQKIPRPWSAVAKPGEFCPRVDLPHPTLPPVPGFPRYQFERDISHRLQALLLGKPATGQREDLGDAPGFQKGCGHLAPLSISRHRTYFNCTPSLKPGCDGLINKKPSLFPIFYRASIKLHDLRPSESMGGFPDIFQKPEHNGIGKDSLPAILPDLGTCPAIACNFSGVSRKSSLGTEASNPLV